MVLSKRGRILRFLRAEGLDCYEAVRNSEAVRRAHDAGNFIGSCVLDSDADLFADPEIRDLVAGQDVQLVLEHPRIPFQSFPYEWAPEMLHAAAALTLDLAADLLDDGLGLKDATPYNILFDGPTPVFVDVLSVERRVADDPLWTPYAQLVRTFLLPLLANRHFGMGLDQIFLARRDGLEPEEVYRWLRFPRKWLPPFLTLVTLPAKLAARRDPDDAALYSRKSVGNAEKARFILGSQFRGLRKMVSRLEPGAGANSTWSGYMETKTHYSSQEFEEKERFVRETFEQFSPGSVLDVGCNTGHFSALAARLGSRVVSIDYDPVVVGQVWRRARAEKLNILPLCVNLTRPTPPIGWNNRECPSFLERARGAFDGVLMLAVIHHMLVTERVPLPEILSMAAELTRGILVVEFIAPEDPMFRRIVRGREHLHEGLNSTVFETACRRHFEIIRSHHNPNSHRWLYALRKR
jgi:SAM-dependent methyltransferase